MHHERAEHLGQQNSAEETTVQIANDFLEHKGRCGERCIEGRRQPSGRARCGGARQRCFASPANAARFDPTRKLLRKACDMIEIHTMSV